MPKAFRLPKVSSAYGAPRGRAGYDDGGHNNPVTVEICPIRIDGGGYDSGGAYWGAGDPLFHAQESNRDATNLFYHFFRARDRKAAEAVVLKDRPNAVIEWIEEAIEREPLHVDYTLNIDDLPEDCVRECSGPGPADAAVAYWRAELGFTVDRERAIDCLAGYGSWSRESLAESTDEELAERILWLACCDFGEFMTWREDNPDADVSDCPSGSSVFVLE